MGKVRGGLVFEVVFLAVILEAAAVTSGELNISVTYLNHYNLRGPYLHSKAKSRTYPTLPIRFSGISGYMESREGVLGETKYSSPLGMAQTTMAASWTKAVGHSYPFPGNP